MRDRRMVKLTSLAPDIVEAILDDALPSGSTLFDFSDDMPMLWEEQRGAATQCWEKTASASPRVTR